MSPKAWRIHPEAEQERDRTAAEYAAERDELGADFRDALRETIASLRHMPSVGTAEKVGKHLVRRSKLRRFPYALFFVELADGYLIAAVAHERRRPGYWKKRLRAVR